MSQPDPAAPIPEDLELKPEVAGYTEKEWLHDVHMVAGQFAESQLSEAITILRYMESIYPRKQAFHRAATVALAFQFCAEQRKGLEEAGIMKVGSNDAPPELLHALYRWLVLMPWQDEIPEPPLKEVLAMIRGEV